jgi:hypothetical protein
MKLYKNAFIERFHQVSHNVEDDVYAGKNCVMYEYLGTGVHRAVGRITVWYEEANVATKHEHIFLFMWVDTDVIYSSSDVARMIDVGIVKLLSNCLNISEVTCTGEKATCFRRIRVNENAAAS